MSVLLVRKPMFYVTDSSINYLAVLESPLSKQENKMNVLNTVTHALTQNPAPDFHSVSVHWRHACQQVLQCIENRGETPPHAKKTHQNYYLCSSPYLCWTKLQNCLFCFSFMFRLTLHVIRFIPSWALGILSSRRKMFKVEAFFHTLNFGAWRKTLTCLRGKAR